MEQILQNITYLLLTCGLFFLFFLIITIFGIIIFDVIGVGKKKCNLNIAEKFFISYGIGLSVFLPISFIAASLRFINFFLIILPIIILDIIYLLKLILSNEISLKKYFYSGKNFLSNKNNIIFVSIVIALTFYQFIIYWNIITYQTSIWGSDPLARFHYLSYMIEKGTFYHVDEKYPDGLSLISVACLSLVVSPNYKLAFFFSKMMPILNISLFIIILALLIRRIYNNNYLVLFSLLIITRANYFNHRYIQFLPSNMATLIILISFIILVSNLPIYLEGFFITSVFLLHPLYALFFILALLILGLIKFFRSIKLFKHAFKVLAKVIIIAGTLFVPYIVFLYTNNCDLLCFINSYPNSFGFPKIPRLFFLMNNSNLFTDLVALKYELVTLLTNWIPDTPAYIKRYYINDSLVFSIFFLFAIIGLCIPFKRSNDKESRDIIRFGKGVILLVISLLFLPAFLPYEIIDFIQTTRLYWLPIRMLEAFCAPIVLMECYAINFFLKNRGNKKILNKVRIFLEKAISTVFFTNLKLKKIRLREVFIAILLVSTFVRYFVINQQNGYPWERGYYFNDEEIELLFFIEENIPKGTTILVPDYINYEKPSSFNTFYGHLLWQYDCLIRNYNASDPYAFYIETKEFLKLNEIRYFLVNFLVVKYQKIVYFLVNDEEFNVIFQNYGTCLFEIVGDLNSTIPSGVFPATWNFLEDNIGSHAANITFINNYFYESGTIITVSRSFSNHFKVLNLSIPDNNDTAFVDNYLGYQKKERNLKPIFGTIEFYLSSSDTNQYTNIELRSRLKVNAHLRIFDSFFQYDNGTEWNNIFPANNNTWYHLRIDFECRSEGRYENLGDDAYHLYINEIKVLDNVKFIKYTDFIDIFRIAILPYSAAFQTYVDAVGYSWDPNYEISNNLVERYL